MAGLYMVCFIFRQHTKPITFTKKEKEVKKYVICLLNFHFTVYFPNKCTN